MAASKLTDGVMRADHGAGHLPGRRRALPASHRQARIGRPPLLVRPAAPAQRQEPGRDRAGADVLYTPPTGAPSSAGPRPAGARPGATRDGEAARGRRINKA